MSAEPSRPPPRRRRRRRLAVHQRLRDGPATASALGCFRTLDEIAAWSVLDADAQARACWPRCRDARARRACRRPGRCVAATGTSTSSRRSRTCRASGSPRSRRACRVRYRPVLFAALLDAHGQKGPAEIPAKRAFTYRFVRLAGDGSSASRSSFPPEHPFNPLPLLRLAIACDCDARGGAPDLPLRLARRAAARPADRMGRARRRRSACRDAEARIAAARGEGRAAPQHRRGDRARRVRRADARDRRRALLGRRRDGDGARLRRGRLPLRRSRVRARRRAARSGRPRPARRAGGQAARQAGPDRLPAATSARDRRRRRSPASRSTSALCSPCAGAAATDREAMRRRAGTAARTARVPVGVASRTIAARGELRVGERLVERRAPASRSSRRRERARPSAASGCAGERSRSSSRAHARALVAGRETERRRDRARPIVAHSARQNFSSSAPTASQRPSAVP